MQRRRSLEEMDAARQREERRVRDALTVASAATTRAPSVSPQPRASRNGISPTPLEVGLRSRADTGRKGRGRPGHRPREA